MVQNFRDNVDSVHDWDNQPTNIQQLYRYRFSRRQSNTKYLAYSCYRSGWISAFFIRHLENKNEKKKQLQNYISTHCEIIITEFRNHDRGRVPTQTLLEHLSKFPYWSETNQHLKTGHIQIYEPLQRAIQTQKMLQELEDDENYKLYSLRLKELLKGIELRTRTLSGACNECLLYYDKKKRKQYEKILHPEN